MIALDDKIPDADVVIVTPTFDYIEIRKILNEKVKCQIVSLEDVINYSILV